VTVFAGQKMMGQWEGDQKKVYSSFESISIWMIDRYKDQSINKLQGVFAVFKKCSIYVALMMLVEHVC